MSAPKAETAVDTVRLDGRSAATVRVTGYEKPLRASRETMMVTNGDSAATLQSVELSIQYLTTGNRQLHKRTLWVNVNAEPGGTVMATLPTWDVNRVFYYHKNRPSNRMSGQATPYLTKITPLRAVYDR